MSDNIYMLADAEICRGIGKKVRFLRLRQNITQTSLADQAQISVSSVKKIENGEIGSFDSLLRIFRVLGELDIFSSLLKEDEMSPNEYLRFVETVKKRQRRRAAGLKKKHVRVDSTSRINNLTESEW